MKNLTIIAIFTLAIGQIVWAQNPDQPRGADLKIGQNDDKTRKALRMPGGSLGGEETLKTLLRNFLSSQEGRPEVGQPDFFGGRLNNPSVTNPTVANPAVHRLRHTSSGGVIHYGTRRPRGGYTPPVIFAPVPPRAKYITLVLDRSGSMRKGFFSNIDPAPSGEKSRYDVLCEELNIFLKTLGPNRNFIIHIFNTGKLTMPGGMKSATAPNIASTMSWLTGALPVPITGGTRPMGAIQDALNPKPDVIYFLTDGRLDPDDTIPTTTAEESEAAVINYIDGNKGHTKIYTIGLSKYAVMPFLIKISALTNGEWRQVLASP